MATREPATAELIGEGHTPAHCILKWPKVTNQEARERSENLMTAQDVISKMGPGADRESLQLFIDDMVSKLPKDAEGLRVDVSLLANNNQERWLDVSGIHLTGKTRLKEQFTFYEKEVVIEWTKRLAQQAIPNYMETSSPAVAKAQTFKHQKYSPMLHTAQMQHQNRRRQTRPEFWGCIASHEGEWSSDLCSMIEWLAMQRYAEVHNGPRRRDGLKPSDASAQCRAMMRDRFAITLARGWGRQLKTGGFPRSITDENVCPNDNGFY